MLCACIVGMIFVVVFSKWVTVLLLDAKSFHSLSIITYDRTEIVDLREMVEVFLLVVVMLTSVERSDEVWYTKEILEEI